MFTEASIQQHLKVDNLSIHVYDTVTSTNTMLKQMGRNGAPHGTVIAAAHQSAGRGRMGRTFYSPDRTGVYFSVLLRPDLKPADAQLITTAAAVACAEALEETSGKQTQIKWVNDIYIDEKKVCGILTEAAFSPDGKKLDFAVLGIGVNITTPESGFPTDIENKAGSLCAEVNDDIRGEIIANILNHFFVLYNDLPSRSFVRTYQQRSMLTGRTVNVLRNDTEIPATVLEIDDLLRLIVQYNDGKVEALSSGDVSIRPL